jgi:nitric oxide reductase activation protein
MAMEAEAGVKFGVPNRSLILIMALCTLLLASVFGNIRQYYLAEQQYRRTATREQEAKAKTAQAEAEAERAKLRRQAAIASSERIDQLYREINNLTQMSEQVMLGRRSVRAASAQTGNIDKTTTAP